MNKKTLTLLVACLGLGVIAVLTLRAPEKGQLAGPRPRPVPAVAKGAIDELKVTVDGKTTTLKKSGDTFRITEPKDLPADPSAVKQAVEKLEGLEFGHVITEQATRHAELEVSDDKAARLVASGGGKPLVDLLIGKPVGQQTMVRQPGKNEVWQVQGAIKYVLARDLKGWRDKQILAFKREDVVEVSSRGPGGEVVVKREPPDDKEKKKESWTVVSSSVPIARLDETTPAGIVSALSSLRAYDFADAVSVAEAGLETAGVRTVAVRTKDKIYTLLVGKLVGDDYYVRTPDSPQVYLARKFGFEKVVADPIDFRDKTLADLPAADLEALDVRFDDVALSFQKKGDSLQLVKPKEDVDPAKVAPLASALAGFKASSFARDTDPKTTGLGKPSLVVSARGKGGAVTFSAGAVKDGADYYVQVKGKPEVYLVKKFLVDRFKKKPADLKKSAPTPASAGHP